MLFITHTWGMESPVLPPWITPESIARALAVADAAVVEADVIPDTGSDQIQEPVPLDHSEMIEDEGAPLTRGRNRDEFELTPRQRKFADEWLTGQGTGKKFNGKAAWEYAGYVLDKQNPYSNPSKALRHPKISAYIKRRLEENTMSAEEIMMRLTELARADYSKIIKIDPVTQTLRLNPEGVVANAQHLKGFGTDANGNPKVDLQDPMAAIRDLIRVLGMAKEGLEIGGMGGGPVRMELVFVGPNDSREPYVPPGAEALPPPESFEDIE